MVEVVPIVNFIPSKIKGHGCIHKRTVIYENITALIFFKNNKSKTLF